MNYQYFNILILLNLHSKFQNNRGEDSIGGMFQQYITKTIMMRASVEQTISTKETNVNLDLAKTSLFLILHLEQLFSCIWK